MEDKEYKILIVDDEPDVIDFLGYNLKKEGYIVYSATNGKDAINKAFEIIPHLIILDVMMPKMNGFEACRQIRNNEKFNNTIIAFLTARGEDYNQVEGFDVGGDDYITKPIKPKVLVSRIKALLKRRSWNNNAKKTIKSPLQVGNLTIDREKFIVYKDKEEIVLTKKEFELLLFLSLDPGKVFTREEIFSNVWGEGIFVGDRTIDVHIRKLREKIGDKYIKTVKGIGYKFVSNEVEQ